MNTKKVIIFSEDFPPWSGGIAQWAAGVAESMHKMGHDVRVVARYREEYASNLAHYDFPIIHIQGNRWKQLRTWYCYRKLKEIYRNGYNADMVIATTWNVARGIVKLAHKNGSIVTTVVHGLEVTRKMSALKKKWLERTLLRSDLIIAVSQFTRDRILKNHSLNTDKILVFPNGVDITKFTPNLETSTLKKRYGLSDEKIILTLARVVERKGHDKVLRAIPEVLKRIPKLKYIIAGVWEDNYYRNLQKLATDLELSDKVIFTGYVQPGEIKYYYNLCDVYIMLSRELKAKGDTEGFGITFLEANACEKPVIGGKSGGVVDAIVDGETGFLVNPNDENEIAEKLLLLLSDQKLAQKLGKQGRVRIEENYTWDIISERILKAALPDLN